MGQSDKIKVFFFANIPIKDVEASFGGATVLGEEILEFIQSDPKFEVKHSPIRFTWKPKLHLIDHFLWIIKFPYAIRKFDVVSFHTTWDFNFTTAPLLWLWAKLLRKKVVYHFFGGNFHRHYDKLPSFLKLIYRNTILKSDTVFFETKEMIHYFSERGIVDSIWLPNARKPVLEKLEEKKYSKRFIFISRVIPEKGINEILEATEDLPNEYVVDIYGPIDERYLKENHFIGKKAKYKGVLNPSDVIDVLKTYDVLLLPSWFKGEGYPGIIIEALSLGMPVISTDWISIPEIIEDGFNGKLIEIKNSEQLRQAMLDFNEDNFQTYRENALKSFSQFNSDLVFEKVKKSYLNE